MNSTEKSHKNLSGIEIQRCYGPEEVRGFDPARDLGVPGEFPFTRGVYSTMYRGRLWTMRQFAGFGSAEESNRRYHYLLQQGNMGLSVAFDMPTLMGYDSDDSRSRGEVGRCGVAVDSEAVGERDDAHDLLVRDPERFARSRKVEVLGGRAEGPPVDRDGLRAHHGLRLEC